jgi:uncharacterized protein YdhG (YjbR/CyaY superfamily)
MPAMAETKKRAKSATNRKSSNGFTAAEKAAMKERAKELKGKGDGESDVLAKIADMPDADRTMAERLHELIKEAAPELEPRTYYGMPAYANAEGKVVVFFQDSGKFNYRYSTLGFQDAANLDDGDIWPVSYALQKWTPAVKKRVVELVKAALS